ncbi:MAG: hypothetical protein JNM89_09270 [Hyphomicrobiaceae bacterium]|nr:hypothetical protein [Hyphomicrobiaceae bacterium]
MSTMSEVIDELAAIQAEFQPVLEEYQKAEPLTDRERYLDRTCGQFRTLERASVSALARMGPADSREALALALLLLDYAVFDGGDAGGFDGTGSHRAAAKGLVHYLAKQAGVAPGDLGIFAEAITESAEVRTPRVLESAVEPVGGWKLGRMPPGSPAARGSNAAEREGNYRVTR